jgi:hypothetical protein
MVNFTTRPALATAALFVTYDGACQGHCHESFADAVRPGKEIGVSKPAIGQGPVQNFFLTLMAKNLIKSHADLLQARK